MGVAFGLAAAVLWGLADWNATIAARSTGSFRVVLGFHWLAVAGLGAIVAATGALDGFDPRDLWKFAWVGALGALSYLAFYKALEIGPISIVSPVVSAYAAVAVVLAVLVLDERLSGSQVAAVAVVLGGVALASSNLRRMRAPGRGQSLGLVLALVTALAIGIFVFGNAYYVLEYGWLVPVFLARGFSAVFLAAASLRRGVPRLPERSPGLLARISLVAAADTSGYVLFNVGVERAEASVVSAASAPYAVIPIVLGVLVLAERPAPLQWLGITGVVGGVVLLGLTS